MYPFLDFLCCFHDRKPAPKPHPHKPPAPTQPQRHNTLPSIPPRAATAPKSPPRPRPKGLLQTLSYRTNPPSKSPDIPPDNIFVPIQPDAILPQIPIGDHHPVPRTGIEDPHSRTLHTNGFYANAFLGGQNQPVWTHPYSVWWGKGAQDVGVLQTWGMNVGCVEEGDVEYGPGEPPKVFSCPRKQCLVLSAAELGALTRLSTDSHLPFSVNINLGLDGGEGGLRVSFPVVQGMAFVTAGYRGATPTVQTGGRGFVEVNKPVMMGRVAKYKAKDFGGRDWLIYVSPLASTTYDAGAFVKIDASTLMGPAGFNGTIQVARNPLGAKSESIYDNAVGTFPIEATLTAVVNEAKATYSFSYTKIGASPLLMFALPHHIQSLDPELRLKVTELQLRTSTKGMATAVWAEKLSFIETNLPVTMSFGPWNPTMSANAKIRFPPDVLSFISSIAEHDLRRAMSSPIPLDSYYYAGKSLSGFATLVWVIKEVLGLAEVANAGLTKLKQEMAKYVQNQQRYPLYYDDSWKGVVSNAGFADSGADFGNTYYNDHHFHFGYFVYTAAVIAFLDPEWLTQGHNKAWTNMLVKDFAESDYKGRDFPFSRSFDWWHGHSWAKGLFESADGKDQESTSEDGFASFALKMWGKVTADANMEKRGSLMLALQARSFNTYFYLTSASVQPPRFLPNKISGILFENKIDYATYFGDSPALIHGIHMVPLSPASALLRPRSFVKEEWDAKFSDGRAVRDGPDGVEGPWRGVLHANLALLDPKASFSFFRDGVAGFWSDLWIDGGASRTWYLVFAAGLGELGRGGR
ncbi:endo-1,3(4)-beta-glucanase 1 precursor [Boeremia exigua]|uniref:endo-1,3(4)-beta-glucanase 1 precursor n=1 Tax=Boeremia exigua TaxID=749465 RepID=UPI001E8E9C36|nr:endo-1,3(4)-beta-glucanase 1 precursor [Boeremia exigua]KAH6632996.1 endo-1,3(4)-beta-glucanase 1 precursor [Boeremia exigua]